MTASPRMSLGCARTAIVALSLAAANCSTEGGAPPPPPPPAGATLPASVDHLPIPQGHPRLLFGDPVRLAAARAWYADEQPEARANDAARLAFGGLMADDASLCRQAIELVVDDPAYRLDENYAEAVSSDEARWIGEAVILTYDWCAPHFTGDERRRLQEYWNQAIRVLHEHRWGGEGFEANNYFWGYMRNGIEWGIATWNDNVDPSAPREVLEAALLDRYRDWFGGWAATYGAGGVPPEGTQYGRYMLNYGVIPLLTLTQWGYAAFEATEFHRGSALYLLHGVTPAPTPGPPGTGCTDPHFYFFPFNDDEQFFDCEPEVARREDYGDVAAAYAIAFEDEAAGWVARAYLERVHPRLSPWMAALLDDGEAADPNELPLAYHAAGANYLFARSSWEGDASVALFQLGTTRGLGHAHLDAGTFQLWRGGQWLSRETTAYTDDIVDYRGEGTIDGLNAIAHNGVLFQGRGAIFGGGEGVPELLRLQADAELTYAVVDLTPSFRSRDVGDRCRYDWPYAGSAIREVLFLPSLDAVVLIDRLTGSGESVAYAAGCPGDFGFRPFEHATRTAAEVDRAVIVHALSPFVAAGDARWVATVGEQELRVINLLPAEVSSRLVDERIGASSAGQHRLELSASGDDTMLFVTVLEMRNAGDEDLDVALEGAGDPYELRIAGRGHDARLTFRDGAASAGGSISLDGAEVPLRADVQRMMIDEAGPRWE